MTSATPYNAPLSFPEPSKLWCYWKFLEGCFNNYTLSDKDVPLKDLSGKWVLITGSNSGIGEQAALMFARCGANLVLASRVSPNEKHPAVIAQHCQAVAPIAETTPAAGDSKKPQQQGIEWWEMDMSRLATVDALAQRWLDTGRPLDILCNNAGIATNPGGLQTHLHTQDDFEFVHQVNFTSHVLLTMRLLPALARAPSARVVCTTSNMTFLARYQLANFNGRGCSTYRLYPNNKLYFQIWLTELHHRLLRSPAHRHITVNGVHPGHIKSGIWSYGVGEGPWAIVGILIRCVFHLITWLNALSPQQGAYSIIHAATSVNAGPDPSTQGVGEPGGKGGGRYFNRIKETENMPHNQDPDARLRVWRKVDEELQLSAKGLLSWTY